MRIPVITRLLRVPSFQFAALYVAVFTVSALALGCIVFWEARSALHQQLTARIENEESILRQEYRDDGLQDLIDLIGGRDRKATALRYLLASASGAHLAGDMPVPADLKPGWRMIDMPKTAADPDQEQVAALVSDLGGGLVLAVGQDSDQIEKVEEAVESALVWTVGIAGALGIAGGVLVSHAFLRRVDAISRAAEAIIEGDPTQRMPLRRTGDEFDRLSATLNRMLDRNSFLMGSLREVTSDIAHDLRTPLTRLYQHLEVAQTRDKPVQLYETSINAALAEAKGLLETFSAVLRIAQVEGGSARSQFGPVDLSSLTETVADAYRPDAEEGGRLLITTVAPATPMCGDKELLTQAIANLVENALRHTPPGTRIDVCLRRCGETDLVLSVADNGPGVAEAELPRLASRFYRGQSSRTTPGNGLGLTLVSAVAQLHGATLNLRTLAPGFCASIVFRYGSGSLAGVRQP